MWWLNKLIVVFHVLANEVDGLDNIAISTFLLHLAAGLPSYFSDNYLKVILNQKQTENVFGAQLLF